MERVTRTDPPVETLEFFEHVRALQSREDPSLRFLGMTADGSRAFDALFARTVVSMWNMQRVMSYYAMRDGVPSTLEQRRLGVSQRLVVNPAALSYCPLLSSYAPYVRVGPVSSPMMVLDASLVVLPGLDGDSIWTSTDASVVAAGIRAYEASWGSSPPAVPTGELPPFTPRQVDISLRLSDGATDRQISRELGISERTVSHEVREIGRRLGTTNRSHTIARICGAPL